MFSQVITVFLALSAAPALSQLVLPTASIRPPPSESATATEQINFTSTVTGIAINATSTPIPPPNACVIFVSANGTVPAFTITSDFPFPTGTSHKSTNGTFTGQINSTFTAQINSTFTVIEQANTTFTEFVNGTHTFQLGPHPTNVSSFATTYYATVYTSAGIPTTSFQFPSPSSLPVCPNITFTNGTGFNNTGFNNTNSSLTNQSLNDTADNKPSSAASILNIGRDLAGATVGAIAGLALAIL